MQVLIFCVFTDFLKPESAEPPATSNHNQFEMKLKRSRTEVFDSRKYSRWQNSSAESRPLLDTWNESDEHSRVYNSRTDMARIG